MAVDLVTVTGNLETLTGSTPTLGRVYFKLSRAGWNDAGEVFAPESVEVVAASDGSFSIALQSTDAIVGGAFYSAVLRYQDPIDLSHRESTLATFTVPTGGPYTLATLLGQYIPASVTDTHTIKRGDTLNLAAQWLDESNRPLDLTGVTVTSALRGPDNVTRSLTVSIISAAAGTFEISMGATVTALLPLGAHSMDVKFATLTRTLRTMTGTIIIDQEVTP